MDSRRSPLAVLRTAFDAVFRRDLSIRRHGRALKLGFAAPDADASPSPPTPAERERLRLEQELADARADLARLLDEDGANRAAMRHLAAVEHALGRVGWKAFERLPLDVLRRALQQMEDAVTNWSPRGLAGLRSRLAVAVAARSKAMTAVAADGASAGTTRPPAAAAAAERPAASAAKAIDKARRGASASAEPTLDDADRALLAAYAELVTTPGTLREGDAPGR